jgi:hypothetical protein
MGLNKKLKCVQSYGNSVTDAMHALVSHHIRPVFYHIDLAMWGLRIKKINAGYWHCIDPLMQCDAQ